MLNAGKFVDPLTFAFVKSVPSITAPEKSTLLKFAPENDTPDTVVPTKDAPDKSNAANDVPEVTVVP